MRRFLEDTVKDHKINYKRREIRKKEKGSIFCLLSFALLGWVVSGGGAVWAGIETFVVGEDNAWQEWGTSNAISYKRTGWIRPEEADSTRNILNVLYNEERFLATDSQFITFTGKAGIPVHYNPMSDGLIWCPKMDFRRLAELRRLIDGTGKILSEGTVVRLRGGLMVSLPDDTPSDAPARLPDNTEVMLSDSTVLMLRPDTQKKNVDAKLLGIVEAMRDASSFDYFNRPTSNQDIEINMLLPASFPVSRIRFFPLFSGGLEDLYMKGFEIYINDGRSENFDKEGRPIFHLFHTEPGNREALVDLNRPKPEYVRYVTLKSTAADPFVIDQFEIYAKGFVPQASYISKIVNLGATANLGNIHWSAREEPGTSVRVYTRVGSDNTVMVYNRINDIGESEPLKGVTDEENREAWERLTDAERGPIYEDTENWSLWSVAYDSSGQDITTKGAKQYLQFMIALESRMASNKAEVDFLSFTFFRPVMAGTLWGEIDPRKDIELGKTTTFNYTVYATIGGDNTGFDTMEIVTPTLALLDSVRIGGRVLGSANYSTTGTEDHLLRVHFPNHRITRTDRVELTFRTAVLSFGTIFQGKVSAGWLRGESLPQWIEEKNAGELSVRGLEASLGKVLSDVRISPNPITPNRDGVNDVATICFTLFQVKEGVPVVASMYALSGSSVWTKKEWLAMGAHEISWDGTDHGGQPVPPGVYIYRILVQGDEKEFVKVGTIVVVY